MDSSTCPNPGKLNSCAGASAPKRLISRFSALPFTLLTIAVVFFALCLGLMLGWSGAKRDFPKSRSVSSSRISPMEHRNDYISHPLLPVAAFNRKMQKNVQTPNPSGDLVVYKNGKIIFRLQSASTTSLLSKSITPDLDRAPKTRIPSVPLRAPTSNPSEKSPQD